MKYEECQRLLMKLEGQRVQSENGTFFHFVITPEIRKEAYNYIEPYIYGQIARVKSALPKPDPSNGEYVVRGFTSKGNAYFLYDLKDIKGLNIEKAP